MENKGNKQAADNAAMEELKQKLAEAEAREKAAKDEAAAANARAEQAEEKLAEATVQKETPGTAKQDTVRIKIPFVKNGPKEDVQVFINGRQYIIMRGAEVDVPKGVAEILANREKMLEIIDAYDRAHAQ